MTHNHVEARGGDDLLEVYNFIRILKVSLLHFPVLCRASRVKVLAGLVSLNARLCAAVKGCVTIELGAGERGMGCSGHVVGQNVERLLAILCAT